jgi:hypothetical protein
MSWLFWSCWVQRFYFYGARTCQEHCKDHVNIRRSRNKKGSSQNDAAAADDDDNDNDGDDDGDARGEPMRIDNILSGGKE